MPLSASMKHLMSGSNHATVVDDLVDDIEDTLYNRGYSVLKPEPCYTHLNEDLLTLSVTWYRLRQANVHGTLLFVSVESLLDKSLQAMITDKDRVASNAVRTYYSNKFLVWALKNQQLSDFRKDLKAFIESDGRIFTEKTIPMVFRLPEFHAFDTAFDVMKRGCTLSLPFPDAKNQRAEKKIATLTPVRSLERNTRCAGKRIQYWLTDELGNANLIDLDAKNPLLPIWNDIYNYHPTIKIAGIFYPSVRDELEFYRLEKWEIVPQKRLSEFDI